MLVYLNVDIFDVLKDKIVICYEVSIEIHNAQQIEVDRNDQNKGSQLLSEEPWDHTQWNKGCKVKEHHHPVAIQAQLFRSTHILQLKVDFLWASHFSTNK